MASMIVAQIFKQPVSRLHEESALKCDLYLCVTIAIKLIPSAHDSLLHTLQSVLSYTVQSIGSSPLTV